MTGNGTGRLADHGPDRTASLEHVVDQLADQLPPGPALPVLMPTVEVGEQNRAVLDDALGRLAGQRCFGAGRTWRQNPCCSTAPRRPPRPCRFSARPTRCAHCLPPSSFAARRPSP